jgi:hypothetical protein
MRRSSMLAGQGVTVVVVTARSAATRHPRRCSKQAGVDRVLGAAGVRPGGVGEPAPGQAGPRPSAGSHWFARATPALPIASCGEPDRGVAGRRSGRRGRRSRGRAAAGPPAAPDGRRPPPALGAEGRPVPVAGPTEVSAVAGAVNRLAERWPTARSGNACSCSRSPTSCGRR